MAGVVGVARARPLRLAIGDLAENLAAHRELAWVAVLVGLAALVHAVNMFDFPYYENDEGTYVAQAWSVFHLGQLAPYTYWYDHPPLGWIQLGLLSYLQGGFGAFGNTIEAGRVSMLLYQVGSTLLLYRVARASGRSIAATTIAVLAFSLSAYGLYFHRRVLLDNIAAFWLLASLVPLLSARVTLSRVWLSAALLGVGILSKEIDIVVVPAMALLVATRVDRSQRWLATVGWLALVLTIASSWLLLAILKGELFPPGSMFGGTSPHVSLVGTFEFQVSRVKDGGLFQTTSAFWAMASSWIAEDPLLVVVGTCASILAAVSVKKHRIAGVVGLMVLSMWLFLGRGGVTLRFYLTPLLPLLALELAWLLDVICSLGRSSRHQRWKLRDGKAPATGIALLALLSFTGTVLGYRDPTLGYAVRPSQLWTSRQAAAQRQAIGWVREDLPLEAGIATDMNAWLDLQFPGSGQPRFDLAHYYYKVALDPEIRDGVFANDWRRIDYLMVTPQLAGDARSGVVPLIQAAYDHADILASFGNGDWPVIIERARWVQSWPASGDALLQRVWREWARDFVQSGHVIDPSVGGGTTAGLQVNALLQAVYMDDRATFDSLWAWTRTHLQVRDGLLSGPWGMRADGTSGLTARYPQPGADTDLALALIFAAHRWNNPAYEAAALPIVRAIWERDTVAVAGRRLAVVTNLSPAANAASRSPQLVDVSALAPYAYRIFATIDPTHAWQTAVDGTYDLLAKVRSTAALGGPVGLVPHWLVVDPRTGAPSLPGGPLDQNDLFDAQASQLGWRIGLDWLWNKDLRAQQELQNLAVARRELAAKSWLGLAYHLDGNPLNGSNSLATYSTALPSVLFGGQVELACSTFTKDVLAPLVGSAPPDPHDAVGRSWGWFATALMDGGLVDLTRPSQTIDWSRFPSLAP